jgi:hypothetical protein
MRTSQFTRFIIEIHAGPSKIIRWCTIPETVIAARFFQDAYVNLPASAMGQEGKYYHCPLALDCGMEEREGWSMYSSDCVEKTNNFEKRKAIDGTGMVAYNVELCVLLLGRTLELKLANHLLKLHNSLKVNYGGFDNYDLRLTFRTVKFGELMSRIGKNPYLLARNAENFPGIRFGI